MIILKQKKGKDLLDRKSNVNVLAKVFTCKDIITIELLELSKMYIFVFKNK